MGYDLEEIRRKLNKLNGQRDRSSTTFWKPEVGEYRIRVLPWPEKMLHEGDGPFIERSWYFIGDNRGFLAPKQFGERDPVEDLIKRLHSDGDKTSAKKLYPKTYAYVAVIVRGDEEKGVQIWRISKTIHARLLSFFVDEDGGDITDPVNGCDLKVTVTQQPGKQYADTTVDMRKNGPLHANEDQVQKWLEGVPNVEEYFDRINARKSADDIKQLLDEWLEGPPPADAPGTNKGKAVDDGELDKLADDLSKKDAEPVKESVKEDVKKNASKNSKQALDDAFADLMDD